MYTVIEKRAKLDCIGFDLRDLGELATRFAKTDFNPDGTVSSRGKPHRFVILPSYDLAASLQQIDDMVESITPHLASMGYSPPNARDVEILKGIGSVIWTPEVIERRRKAFTDLGNPEVLIPQMQQIDFNVRLSQSIHQWMEHERLSEQGVEVKTEEQLRSLAHAH